MKADIVKIYDEILAQARELLPVKQNLVAIQNQIIEPTVGSLNSHFSQLKESNTYLDRKNTLLSLIGITSGILGVFLTIYPYIFSGPLEKQREKIINYYLAGDQSEIRSLANLNYEFSGAPVFPGAKEIQIEYRSFQSIVEVHVSGADMQESDISSRLPKLDNLLARLCLGSNSEPKCKLIRLPHENINLGKGHFDNFTVQYATDKAFEFPGIFISNNNMAVVTTTESFSFEDMTKHFKRHNAPPPINPDAALMLAQIVYELSGFQSKLNLDANIFDKVFLLNSYDMKFQRTLLFN